MTPQLDQIDWNTERIKILEEKLQIDTERIKVLEDIVTSFRKADQL